MAREKGKGGRLYRHRLPEAGAVKKVREEEGHQERGAARQELKEGRERRHKGGKPRWLRPRALL